MDSLRGARFCLALRITGSQQPNKNVTDINMKYQISYFIFKAFIFWIWGHSQRSMGDLWHISFKGVKGIRSKIPQQSYIIQKLIYAIWIKVNRRFNSKIQKQKIKPYPCMSQSQGQNQGQGQKQSNPKLSLLWNVVDPDDPYDIRKSMIARLPDHSVNFMGGNLELVCLMQAAEIQRLNIYLAEFQLRYRELDRKQLDRHSYEIQIKELSERAGEVSKYKTQNLKLVEYIKKLTIQLQDLSRRPQVSDSLQTQYNELSKRYQALLIELQNSRETMNIQTTTLNKSLQDNKELRIKYDKLDKQRLTELTQERQKYELKIRERIQIQIKEVEQKWSVKVYQFESDCRLYREQIESKNHEIASLMQRNQSLKRELQNKEKQIESSSQYDEKILELERINRTLAKKGDELQNIFAQYTKIQTQLRDVQWAFQESQERNRRYKAQIDRLQSINEGSKGSDSKIIQLENKCALLSQQIQRLSYLLENKNRDYNQLQSKMTSIRVQHEAKIRQITSQYELKLSSNRGGQQKIDALQSELRPLRSMTMELKLKNQLLVKELSTAEINLKRVTDLENQLRRSNSMIAEQNNIIMALESKLKSAGAEGTLMIRQIFSRFRWLSTGPTEPSNDQIINIIIKELQKKQQLREELEKQILANHTLKKQNNDLRRQIQQFQADLKKGNLISFAVMDTEIRKNVEETKRKLQIQYEREIQMLIQDKNRLQNDKRTMSQDIIILKQKLERKSIETQQSYVHIETRYMNQIHDMTGSLKTLREENQRLNQERVRLKNSFDDLEKQVTFKQREQNQIIKDLNRRYEELRAINDELRRQNAHLRQELVQGQQIIFRSQREIQERFIKIYTSQLQDKDNIISSLERQVKAAREEVKSLQATYDTSSTSLKNYRDRLLMVSQEIERLNQILMGKNKEIQGLRAQIGSVEDNFKRQLGEKEEEIRRIRADKSNQEQFEKEINDLRRQLQSRDQTIQKTENELRQFRNLQQAYLALKLQHDSQKSSTQQFETKILEQDIEIRRLNQNLSSKNREIEGLRGQLGSVEAGFRKQLGDKDEEIRRFRVQIQTADGGLRKEVQNKQEQIRMLRTQIQNIEISYRKQIVERETQIQTMRVQITNFGQDGERKAKERQNEIRREYEDKISRLTQEKLSIQMRITSQWEARIQRDAQTYKSTIERNEKDINDLRRELQARDQSIQRIESQLRQFRTLQQSYLALKLQHDSQKSSTQQFQAKIAEQDMEIKRLRVNKTNVEQYEKEINDLRGEIQRRDEIIQTLQRSFMSLKEAFSSQKSASQKLESKITEQDIEIRNLKQMLKQISESNERAQDIQIRNLKQMLKQMQIMCADANEERDRFIQISNQLQVQLQKLRKDKEVLQTTLIGLSNQYEKFQGLYAGSQPKIQNQEKTIRNLTTELGKITEHSQKLMIEVRRLSKLIEDRDKEINGLKGHRQDKEGLLAMEIERLTFIIEEKNKQIGSLKGLANDRENLIRLLHQKDQQLTHKISIINSLQSQSQSQKSSITQLQTHLSQLQIQLTTLKTSKSSSEALQRRCQQYEIEIRNLKNMLQQMEEISAHTAAERDQLFQMSHRYKAEVDQLSVLLKQRENSVSQGAYAEIKNAYNALMGEFTQIQITVETVTKKNKEYEMRIKELITEIDRLALVIRQREKNSTIIIELQQKISRLEIEFANKSQQAKQWQQKYIQLYQAYKTESQISKTKILEYQKKITSLDQQFEQINILVRTIRQQNQQLKSRLGELNDLIQKNKFLSSQIDRLTLIITQLKQQLSDTRLRLTDQMSLEKRIQEHMSLMVILFTEIETLRNRVSQTEQECENVRRSSLTPHRIDRQVGRSLDSREKGSR